MCGIAGFIGPYEASVLATLGKHLSHRGPDGEGEFIDTQAHVGLVHRRLSIIDLTAGAQQPMSDTSGRYVLTFNGEIYNYRQLRNELEAQGHRFNSQSDTEVILYAFREWGLDCLARFRGMFAFALLDRGPRYGPDPRKPNNLPLGSPYVVLARDRLGIKPLLYSKTPTGLVFCSELQPLRRSGLVPAVLSGKSLYEYCRWGSIPQPETIYQDVFHLLAGSALVVSAPTRRTQTFRYWELTRATSGLRQELAQVRYEEQVARLREHLTDATRAHLVADVPIGAFLSGGVDSSSVVALMSQSVSSPIKTFSVGFEGGQEVPSELTAARKIATALQTDHTEIQVTDAQVKDLFRPMIQALDQPSVDGFNTYLVSRGAAQAVKVAISGLGGDELFAGYPHFAQYAELIQKSIPSWVRRFGSQLENWPRRFWMTQRNIMAAHRGDLGHFRRMHPLGWPRFLLSKDVLGNQVQDRSTIPAADSSLPPLAQMSQFEIENYLLNTLLRDADVMSMASALELRPVLLDHPLVEYAFALPDRAKIREGHSKSIFVDAVRGLVPDWVFTQKKQGFELPFGRWLNGALHPVAVELLASSSAKKALTPGFRTYLQFHQSTRRLGRQHWPWFVLLAWLEYTPMDIR